MHYNDTEHAYSYRTGSLKIMICEILKINTSPERTPRRRLQ